MIFKTGIVSGRFCGAVFNDHGSLEVMFSLQVGFKDSNETIVGDVTIITNLYVCCGLWSWVSIIF